MMSVDEVNVGWFLFYWGLILLWGVGVGFDNTCTISGKWNVSRVIPTLHEWVYKTLRLSPLMAEHSDYDCLFPIKTIPDWNLSVAIFNFYFMKFVFQISGGIKIWDPIEDSNIGGPSSITIRMEQLFAFQFWYCELWVENQWGGDKKALLC